MSVLNDNEFSNSPVVSFETPRALTTFSSNSQQLQFQQNMLKCITLYALVRNLQIHAYSKLNSCLGNEITHLKCSLHVSSNALGIITYAQFKRRLVTTILVNYFATATIRGSISYRLPFEIYSLLSSVRVVTKVSFFSFSLADVIAK